MAEVLNADRPDIRIKREILVRTRSTESQVGMTQEERQANIRNVFRVRKPSEIRGKGILLADDVITTGSTANECARALLENGARHVDVLTLGQTQKRLDTNNER
ncbi:ComF family protein [Desulfonema magnum]|nr:phosphoribosyltransferase family protein [Desulfonema magnum]